MLQSDIHIEILESCNSIMYGKYEYAIESMIDKWIDRLILTVT